MAVTTNYSWSTPDDTALVKDGAAAIRSLGTAIDTTVFNNAGAAIAKTIIDAKGDLIVGTAADTAARLAVGATNGHVLQVDSSTASGIKWDAVSAGGMTLINTGGTTLTGASVTIGSIPSTYRNLQLIIQNFKPANDGEACAARFNSDSGTRYRYSSTNVTTNATFGQTSLGISESADNSVATNLIILEVYDYANTTTWKLGRSTSITVNEATTTNVNMTGYFHAYNQTAAITDIVLLPTGGNFTSGTAYLYGVK